jgi:glycerophosphoryl diester phosphodiesterase
VLTELPELRITIELKTRAVIAPALALLERLGAWDRVCIGGYNQRWLDRVRTAAGPKVCTSMAQRDALGLRGRAWFDALPGPASRLPAPRVGGNLAQLPHRLGRLTVVDTALLEVAHGTGREVHVWTVNNRAEMAELLDLGVDGILTDRPDLLRDVLRERGQWPG